MELNKIHKTSEVWSFYFQQIKFKAQNFLPELAGKLWSET